MKESFDRMIEGRMIRKRILIILPTIILSFTPKNFLALLFISLMLGNAPITRAANSAPAPAAPQQVSPTELNRAIDEVIQQRKYTWRMPREKLAEEPAGEEGLIARFFKSIGRMFRTAIRNTLEWLGNLLRKLFGNRTFSPNSTFDWIMLSQMLLYVLFAAVLSTVAFLLYRMWQNRRRQPQILQTEAIQPVPDLTDENVGADQLPEDGWTKLARELLARGEYRLALRAFYLASLAHLAERNLISLTRFKSNHDYELELSRRAHSFPNLLQVFGENVGAFDRVWYGTHEASDELVAQFASNVERLKAGG
jgi:hypothetical protein